MSVKLLSSGGGSVTIADPASTASNFTLNPPLKNGTLVSTGDTASVTQTMLAANVAGNGPSFSAYNSSNVSIPNVTNVKLACNTENFDTNNNYDSSTNYRFQPTVAGYYFLSVISTISGAASAGSVHGSSFVKNGSPYGPPAYSPMTSSNYTVSSNSVIMYLNGSTDYVEANFWHNGGGTFIGVAGACIFQGYLARAA